MKQLIIVGLAVTLLFSNCQTSIKEQTELKILPPEQLYGDLFYDVQLRDDLFPDSKTFVDCIPKRAISEILNDYKSLESKDEKEILLKFLNSNFTIPGYNEEAATNQEATSVNEHIENLWDMLRREADQVKSGTLIPLKNPYVVPGGRFREVYYWDSYFTMLGLQVDGKVELMDNILKNFSNLIDSMGFVPNGNRTYYSSRSQPPFFAAMVDLHVTENKTKELSEYLPSLLKEYDFWMMGADDLTAGKTRHRRVVRLANGEVLNRYWDDRADPRSESYREDVETIEKALDTYPNKTDEQAYRDLRAACESGWDFSTRWFEIGKDGKFDLASIHTTEIIPVDLNSLMYNLEMVIARAYEVKGEESNVAIWKERAEKRKSLIIKYCWNSQEGFFMDYDFVKEGVTSVKSLAGLYPLFFNIANEDQATAVAKNVKSSFLMPGGVVSTLNASGQQWDYPNGWAPLQWMTIKGLKNYSKMELADTISARWIELNTKVFNNTGKMTEKYNVVDLSLDGGGGEYPNQDGFGWTNGVFQKLSKESQE